MSAHPYMPLYVADFLADTAHLSAAESGAYMLLLMNYWQRAKPLNNAGDRLRHVVRMTDAEWQQVKPVLAELFRIEGDTWHHKRVDAELARAKEKSEKARASRNGTRSTVAEPPSSGGQSDDGRSFDERATTVERPSDSPGYPIPGKVIDKPNLPSSGSAREENGRVGFDLKAVGVGLGGDVSSDAKRAVCQTLGLTDCEPIVTAYRAWSGSKRARDADAMFIRSAPKIFARLPEHVRKRILIPPDEPIKLTPIKPSASLLKTLGAEHGRH